MSLAQIAWKRILIKKVYYNGTTVSVWAILKQ